MKNQSAIKKEKMESKIKKPKKKAEDAVETVKLEDCNDRNCNTHGGLKTRGKIFEGRVVKKFHKRITIELERMSYVKKYERYKKSRIKIHARLPECMEKTISIGDIVRVRECRPLSKIIHFVVVEKIKSFQTQEEGK